MINTPGDCPTHRGGLLTGVYTGWLTGIGAGTLLQTLRIVAPSMIGLLEHEGDELQAITTSMQGLTAQVPPPARAATEFDNLLQLVVIPSKSRSRATKGMSAVTHCMLCS